MKAKDLQPLLAAVASRLQGFKHDGVMIYSSPIRDILKGFYFDRSDLDKSAFAVNAIMLPAYVPWRIRVFLFGKRIGGGSSTTWSLNDPELIDKITTCIESEGLQHIRQVSSPADIVSLAQNAPNRDSAFMKQAVAFSLAICGDNKQAVQALDDLMSTLDATISWQNDIRQDSQMLHSLLMSEPENVRELFKQWKDITKETFKIQDDCNGVPLNIP
jgi:hypothetical protein